MLKQLAKLLGIPERLAEDALHSERAAKHVLSRRGFFGGVAGAMAGAAVFSIPDPVQEELKLMMPEIRAAISPLGAGRLGCATGIYMPVFFAASSGIALDWYPPPKLKKG